MHFLRRVLLCLLTCSAPAHAVEWPSFGLSVQPASEQSLFLFGGRTSPTDLWSTAVFNLNQPSSRIRYDNAIIGGAYRRDLLQFGNGLYLSGEIGVADRFGYYKVCCYPVPGLGRTEHVVHSGELWGGVGLRYEATVFERIRVSPALVWGLSGVSNPIGQEAFHQLDRLNGSNARVLFYLALETAFSLKEYPNAELVVRLHHRSGGYGTLGGLKEGNNANVAGVRYRF